jgi:hypothetical protein
MKNVWRLGLRFVPMLERFIACRAKDIALQITLRIPTKPSRRPSRSATEQWLGLKEIRECPDS